MTASGKTESRKTESWKTSAARRGRILSRRSVIVSLDDNVVFPDAKRHPDDEVIYA
jgi:hypothetical protein